MELSIKQSYLAMFYLLDSIYDNTKDECLGSLLGGFNPHLFVESMSADPAAWGDWKNMVIRITNKELLTVDEALEVTQKFIIFHRDEFGFDLDWLIDRLNTMTSNNEDWLSSIKKALSR